MSTTDHADLSGDERHHPDHPDRPVDGRRARRERGRLAALDAMIDLILEEGTAPRGDQVAARAGVSQASLFRYFPTLDDLRSDAIARYFDRFDDLIAIPDIGEGPRRERIERFVSARNAFYERTEPMARLARRQARDVVAFADTLTRVRSTFAGQVAQHFASELDELDDDERAHRLAVVAALTSFETWEQLEPLDDGRVAALVAALDELLPA